TAAAALEGYYKKKKGKLIDLSPQNIIDCSRKYGNKGCEGGNILSSFEYAKEYGIAKESKYPYVQTEQPCKWQKKIGIVTVKDYAFIPQGDELALKHAVAKQGPIAAIVYSLLPDFKVYKSGIYSSPNCQEPDHAVLIVGYGTHPIAKDYWIVKNRFALIHLLNYLPAYLFCTNAI
ncbi:unnamed protein product, partial [Onchocerca flexuosa]|uniref:Pept_C1 domain-containing protein n=1 Tax=Onchocerca flexuosa TaxID=387005 RepID=A0A183HT81_9BILA